MVSEKPRLPTPEPTAAYSPCMKIDDDERVIRLRDQIQAEEDREKLGELVNQLMGRIFELERKESAQIENQNRQ